MWLNERLNQKEALLFAEYIIHRDHGFVTDAHELEGMRPTAIQWMLLNRHCRVTLREISSVIERTA